MLHDPQIFVLGEDPGSRTFRINANSFQQNAITTVNNWQYVAYYTENTKHPNKACHINLARRKVGTGVKNGEWDTLTFEDYDQVVDDGHNTISVGVCKGDGSIHLSFDHHCDQLRYRVLKPSRDLENWDISQFTKTLNTLPGLEPSEVMKEVSYPRFVNIGEDLLFTYRIGQAGKGSDVLYHYSSQSHTYTYRGVYLTGTTNCPYVNGLSYLGSRLHVSWCYRNFIQFPPSTAKDAHKQQAGPNGPENNFDLNYAFSDDQGITWRASDGGLLSSAEDTAFGEGNSVMPNSKGVRVFEIPMGSGILNQESQAVDREGVFWVLNREKVEGVQSWMVYRRDLSGLWKKITIDHTSPPTDTGARARICVDRQSNVYLILPGNTDTSLSILQGKKEQDYKNFASIWKSDGYDGEPLVDEQRLEVSDVLSVFTRTAESPKREVVVLDFDLS